MRFLDLIIKKRDGGRLTKEELTYFANAAAKGEIPDYQIASMLMAVYFNSLDEEETADLTIAMAESGNMIDLSPVKGIVVDKHSTGGVADTVTLILASLVASAGVPVLKMSGKGLGFSGGTIDKLASVPGFSTEMPLEQAVKQCDEHGIVILQQMERLAPADKKLYSLRSVTGTVESIPLIAASVMSKKLAGGAEAMVLDVKCGTGAFMKNEEEAKALAETMVSIGKNAGRQTVALITDMNQPLGMYIGNSLEIIEAAEVLKGNVKGDVLDVTMELGAHMMVLAENDVNDLEEGRRILLENLQNGKGLAKFREFIEIQGGDPKVVDDYSLLPLSSIKREVHADKTGYIGIMDTEALGNAFVLTGGGRLKSDDELDYGAGIIMKVRIGDKVEKGDVIAEIFTEKKEIINEVEGMVAKAVPVCDEVPEKPKLIKYTIS